METLPLELISLLTTKYLISSLDKLSFLLASPRHLAAFVECGHSWEKWRFCSQFHLDPDADLTMSSLVAIQEGLQKLSRNEIRACSRYHYSIDRRKGFVDDSSRFRNAGNNASNLDWIRNQITNSTFAYVFDDDIFVLIHSHNGKHFSNVTAWPICVHYQLRFEVMGQDVILHKGLLVVMPLARKASKYERSALLVYDPSTGQEKANFVREGKRRPPNVYKESGEKRLYSFEDKIVQVFPSDIWTLLIYKLENGLDLVKVIPLTWVDSSVIGQLFCSDQQGPHLVLAFFAEKLGLSSYATKVITIDLQSLDIEFIPVSSGAINLDLPVSGIQLFLTAATEYKRDKASFLHHYRQRREGRPLVIILFPDGNLTTSSAEKYEDILMRSPLQHGNPRYKICKELWHHSELCTLDNKILVMHELPNVGRLVYATDLQLSLLWSMELDKRVGSPLDQRLFLYASHGLVWLSNAVGCLLLDCSNGREMGTLRYPDYSRVLPELESLNEDTSPYAQTGFSVWSVAFSSKDSIMIVHDIERCSPTIADRIKL